MKRLSKSSLNILLIKGVVNLKRKTQELTLIFGSAKTGKSENILEILENKEQEEKVYIIDYIGKYKELLSKKQIEFNYHRLKNSVICAPLPFESYINKLKGEEYTNEFYTHLEENVKIISGTPFCPLSEITTRKALIQMYKLAGITADEYSPNPQVEKFLSREMFYEVLQEIDPEGGQLLFDTVESFKKSDNYSEDLMNFTVQNSSLKIEKGIVILELGDYLYGNDALTDLKVESLLLRLRRQIRNEGKAIKLIFDSQWPIGEKFARVFKNATDKMKVYYLNDSFTEFQAMQEEIFFLSEEIRFHRTDLREAENISKYFDEPKMIEQILTLPNKSYLSVKPAKDVTQYGDYLFRKNEEQINKWVINWNEKD